MVCFFYDNQVNIAWSRQSSFMYTWKPRVDEYCNTGNYAVSVILKYKLLRKKRNGAEKSMLFE